MIVQFIDNWNNYFTGDIAGFNPQVALMLIDKEYAIEVKIEDDTNSRRPRSNKTQPKKSVGA